MQIRIKDSEFKMFGKDAKNSLTKHILSYLEHIKEEAEKVAVARNGITDAKVTKEIIEGVIKLQGHHVGNKPSIIFSFMFPILEAILGGLLCNALFVENKTVWHGILIASCLLSICGVVYLSYKHERRN